MPPLPVCDVPPLISDDVPPLPASGGTWRTEVKRRGKFWQWRRGRGDQRVSRYGGKFDLLSPERQAEYERNKRAQAKRRKRATTRAK